MSNVLDSLLVELGLETDKRSFEQGERMFNQLSSAALQFAAVAGGGLGLHQLTFEFAKHYDRLGKFSDRLGISAQYVDSLGYAFERAGGTAQDAYSTIESVQGILDQIRYGDNSILVKIASAGVDPSFLEGVNEVEDAINRISEAAATAPDRRLFLESLFPGSDTHYKLFGDDPRMLQDYLSAGADLSPVSDEMLEAASDFNDSLTDFSRSVDGLTNELSERLLPELSERLDRVTDFLVANRDGIVQRLDTALPWLEATAVGIGVLAAEAATRKGMDLLGGGRAGVVSLLGAAGIGALWSARNWDADDVEDFSGVRLPETMFLPIREIEVGGETLGDRFPRLLGRPDSDGSEDGDPTTPTGLTTSPDTAGIRIDSSLMEALAMVESSGQHYDPTTPTGLTTSKTGALGKYQIIPSTARDPGYGVAPLRDHSEAEHERFASDYLAAMLAEFGDLELAITAYNWGVGNVKEHGEDWREAAERKAAEGDWRAQQALDYPDKFMDALDEIHRLEATAPSRDDVLEELYRQPSPADLGFRSSHDQPNPAAATGQPASPGTLDMGGFTIHIHDATDPQGTAREVERQIRKLANMAIDDFREPYV